MTLETNPPKGCDSVVCTPDTVYRDTGSTVYRDTGSTVFDTVIVYRDSIVRDSIYIWCIRVQKGHDRKDDIYECDNGYRGPLF